MHLIFPRTRSQSRFEGSCGVQRVNSRTIHATATKYINGLALNQAKPFFFAEAQRKQMAGYHPAFM
ncbi:hypothetical protein MCP1_200066 [Candidatus Terasakiella magnetica]|nr:hypothetical protein MCP1_200066 [Candidatus Terasakiella magnetica]